MTCTCTDSSYDTGSLDCPIHGAELCAGLDAEHAAEIAAENAWLRYAEAPDADALAFEAYENALGLS